MIIALVLYTNKIISTIIIHLGVGESGGYLPHRFAAWKISTTTEYSSPPQRVIVKY